VRDFLIEVIGIEKSRISVVHHGIDATFRRLPPPDGKAATNPPPYILTVGNIFPVKNFIMAVHVLAALVRDFPQLRLKMAGSTAHPYCEELRDAARSSGVLDRIDFLGFTPPDRLVPLMNATQMLLMPSLTEGCPVTLLEAMACGTAVVASGRGGIPEVGADAIRIVNNPEDRPAWIASVSGLLHDQAALARLGDRAEMRARQFSWQRAVQGTLQAYDSLADRGRRAD
jgi:glycosyltransferase involved in cell wall biosynthesis